VRVVELRRYTLKPGARETLVELFCCSGPRMARRRSRSTPRAVPPVGAPERDGLLTVAICPAGGDEDAVEAALGKHVLARFVTEYAQNDFPALPVREDVDVKVWLAADAHELPAGIERLRLRPTPRSLLP
jgi:hypothetical protein